MDIAPVASSPPAESEAFAVGYCREARRLRGQFGRNPGELQSRLRALAQRRDRARARLARPIVREVDPAQLRPALEIPTHHVSRRVIDQFIDAVTGELDGSLLRFSQREALLRRASRLGISRFHANLIIASLLHQHRDDNASSGRNSSANGVSPPPSKNRLGLFAWASLILLVEVTTAALAWRHFTA